MKRTLAFVLAVILVLIAVPGCSSSSSSAAPASAPVPAASSAAPVPETKWPEKDLTFNIGFSAGGSADIVGRALAKEMGKYLKVNINCINVTGANGSTAGQQVVDSKDAGYVCYAGNCHNCGGWRTSGYADVGWEDFYGFWAVSSPYILFVNGTSKYQTVEDLVADMKANPGKIKWGTAGLGSINDLTGRMMLQLLGCEANSIPYQGGRDAAIKVMADEVAFSWAGMSDVMDLALTGQIRVLGIAADNDLKVDVEGKNSYTAPSLVKTYPELSKVENLLFWGVSIPRKTDPAIVSKFKDAFEYAIQQPEFKEVCASRFLDITPFIEDASDKQGAYLETVYAWGLYDNGLAAKGVSPEDFKIPRPDAFTWPSDLSKTITLWP